MGRRKEGRGEEEERGRRGREGGKKRERGWGRGKWENEECRSVGRMKERKRNGGEKGDQRIESGKQMEGKIKVG